MSKLLELNTKDIIQDFLSRCRVQGYNNSTIEYLSKIVVNTVKHLGGTPVDRVDTRVNQELESKWYASLENGTPDFSIYNSIYYLGELCACFIVYSRKHLINIQSDKSLFGTSICSSMGQVNGVVDMGCGLGYTTAVIKDIFPFADVFGYDFEGSNHMEFSMKLSTQHGFKMVYDLQKINSHIDLVFASEYFEHIVDPVQHLEEVVRILNPKYFLIANSFGGKAIGHFNEYVYRDKNVDCKKIGKIFNTHLRDLGYEKIKTKLWNNRPSFWKKK